MSLHRCALPVSIAWVPSSGRSASRMSVRVSSSTPAIWNDLSLGNQLQQRHRVVPTWRAPVAPRASRMYRRKHERPPPWVESPLVDCEERRPTTLEPESFLTTEVGPRLGSSRTAARCYAPRALGLGLADAGSPLGLHARRGLSDSGPPARLRPHPSLGSQPPPSSQPGPPRCGTRRTRSSGRRYSADWSESPSNPSRSRTYGSSWSLFLFLTFPRGKGRGVSGARSLKEWNSPRSNFGWQRLQTVTKLSSVSVPPSALATRWWTCRRSCGGVGGTAAPAPVPVAVEHDLAYAPPGAASRRRGRCGSCAGGLGGGGGREWRLPQIAQADGQLRVPPEVPSRPGANGGLTVPRWERAAASSQDDGPSPVLRPGADAAGDTAAAGFTLFGTSSRYGPAHHPGAGSPPRSHAPRAPSSSSMRG